MTTESIREQFLKQGLLGIAVLVLAGAVVVVGQKWEATLKDWRQSERADAQKYVGIIERLIENEIKANTVREEQVQQLKWNAEYMKSQAMKWEATDAKVLKALKELRQNQ